MAKIRFLPQDVQLDVRSGSEFLELRERGGLPLKFGCTHGECGVCAIKIVEGSENLTKLTKQEKAALKGKELQEGFRLACQCALNGDVTIETNVRDSKGHSDHR